MKRILLLLSILIILLSVGVSSGLFGISWPEVASFLRFGGEKVEISPPFSKEKVRIVTEESVVIEVVEKVSPSVVTVGMSKTRTIGDIFEFDPFDPFSIFRIPIL